MEQKIAFIPLEKRHLSLLHRFLQEEHVRKFWDDGDRTIEQVERHYFQERDVEAFIILLNEEEIGYIQAYEVTGEHDFKAYRHQIGTTLGIDFFIGKKEMLGKGLSYLILKNFIAYLKKQKRNISRILVDPASNNLIALHIYEKCGFKKLGGYKDQIILSLDGLSD